MQISTMSLPTLTDGSLSNAPRVSRAECVKAETESFVSKFGVAAIEPMLATFVEEKKLSAEKIARLKRILDEKDAGIENGQ